MKNGSVDFSLSTVMYSIVFSLAIYLGCVSVINSILCYECESLNTNKCNDPFKKENANELISRDPSDDVCIVSVIFSSHKTD